jgi:hypothetical protein
MRKFYYLLILPLLLSCNKEPVQITGLPIDTIPYNKYYNSEIFADSNLKLYGKLQFLYIYADAGIVAGPGKIDPNYDFLEIKKYGIYGKVKDNNLIETGKIEIVAQDNSKFEIKFSPDRMDNNTLSSWYYITYSNDSIIMRDASVGCGVSYNVYKRKN